MAITSIKEGIYSIQNYSGKMLNVFANAGQATLGTNICASNDDGTNEQRFKIDSLGNNKFRMTSLSNSKKYCVDIYGSASNISNGNNVHVYNPSTTGTNIWYFDDIGSGYYVIQSSINTNLVLTAVNSEHRANIIVQTYSSKNNLQKWKLNLINAPQSEKPLTPSGNCAPTTANGGSYYSLSWKAATNATKYCVNWSFNGKTGSSGWITQLEYGWNIANENGTLFVDVYSGNNIGQSDKPFAISVKVTAQTFSYPTTYYWKLPWSSGKKAKFTGGYGKSNNDERGAHFKTRIARTVDDAYKRSLAIDFASEDNNFTICAPASGIVEIPQYNPGGYGKHIILITDDEKYTVILAHLKEITVKAGRVSVGTPIGLMGNTGNEGRDKPMGQHLHFEIRGVLPNVISEDDYSPITYLFGKPIRNWAYSYERTPEDDYYQE